MADFDFLEGFDADAIGVLPQLRPNQQQKVKQNQTLQKKLLRQQQTVWVRLCLAKSLID